MSKRQRRTQVQLAEEAEARVRKEQAKLQLERVRFGRDAVKHRRKMLSISRAAEHNRFTADWHAPQTSADGEILGDLATTTARARQTVRDNPYGKSILRSFRRNVVGTGITPSIDGKPYQRAWDLWSSRAAMMDAEKTRDMLQVQEWVMNDLVTVGEAFVVRWIMGQGSDRHLVLQCFESEQLDTVKLRDIHTGNEIRGGVEVDDAGAPVAYHFYRRHPHDVRGLNRPAPLMLQSMRIPASMVCHVYDPERVRQARGISRLRPVLRKLRDLDEYDGTQLRAARAEANIGMVVKAPDDGTDPLELDGLNVAYLGPEEEMTPFTPTRPGGTYDPFVKAQLRAIAAGVGISYEQLARDLTQTTYSGGRQGSIDDHREFDPMIILLIRKLCQPIFEDFVFVWALRNPEESGEFFLRDEPEVVSWQGQGWDWVDPEQQGKATERKMKLGLTNRTIEAGLLGRTVKEIDEQAEQDGTNEIVRRLLQEQPEAGPADPSVTQPEEEAVDAAASKHADAGVDAEQSERLSGIDAQRAQEMLDRVSRGEASGKVVMRILTGMGFDTEDAEAMIRDAEDFTPANADPVDEEEVDHAATG